MSPLGAQADNTKHHLTGTVLVGPTCAGPQVQGQSCTAPLAAVEVRLTDAADRVVARATTDSEGRFLLSVPAGNYSLHAGGPGKLPRCPVLPVVLPKDADRPLELTCNSGLR